MTPHTAIEPHLAEILEGLIWDWSAGRLQRLEPILRIPLCPLPDLHLLAPAVGALVAAASTTRWNLRLVLSPLSDESLVLAAQKDFLANEALDELLPIRYERNLRIWFRQLGANNELADELTQELCFRFCRSGVKAFDTARGKAPFAAYLRSAVRNLFHEKGRRKQFPEDPDEIPVDPGPGPADAAELKELDIQIENALTQLPDDLQAVMRLSISGLGRQDIAREMGINVEWVDRRLHAARVRLREILGL